MNEQENTQTIQPEAEELEVEVVDQVDEQTGQSVSSDDELENALNNFLATDDSNLLSKCQHIVISVPTPLTPVVPHRFLHSAPTAPPRLLLLGSLLFVLESHQSSGRLVVQKQLCLRTLSPRPLLPSGSCFNPSPTLHCNRTLPEYRCCGLRSHLQHSRPMSVPL